MNANESSGPAVAAIRGSARWLLLILLASALLEISFASGKGLVLDEFHTHFHATRTSWAAFWETLFQDNHPPLSFLLIGALTRVFGDGELVLRSPAMVFALLDIVLIWRLARDHGRVSAGLAAALLAASSLHLDFGTQARMYALHGLAVTGCAVSLTRILSGSGTRRTGLALGMWLWIGLHNHYFFVQYSMGLAGGALLAAWLEPEARKRLRTLVVPLVVAGCLCLPWYSIGFPKQWAHALPPGGDDLSIVALLEAYVHLFFLNVRLGAEVPLAGGFLRELFILCGALMTLLALCGAGYGLSRTANSRTRVTTCVLFSVAFVVPCAAFLLAHVMGRAGFTWHYILPSAAAEAWLIALAWHNGPMAGLRRLASVLVLVAAALLALLNARGRGSEDYPAAVARILADYQEGDGIISVEWQPNLFPQGMPWDYYAPRLQPNPPARMAMNQSYSLLDWKEVKGMHRLHVLRTSLPGGQHLFRMLKKYQFHEVHRAEYGFGVLVLLFE